MKTGSGSFTTVGQLLGQDVPATTSSTNQAVSETVTVTAGVDVAAGTHDFRLACQAGTTSALNRNAATITAIAAGPVSHLA